MYTLYLKIVTAKSVLIVLGLRKKKQKSSNRFKSEGPKSLLQISRHVNTITKGFTHKSGGSA